MKRYLVFILLLLLIFLGCDKDTPKEQFILYSWNTSTPEAQGMTSQILDSAFIVASNTSYIHGLVVVRNGYIVKEGYYNGYGHDYPHTIMSVSKSFLSALAGIAIEKDIISLDEKVMDYFPEYEYPEMDQRKYDITIEHLLKMRMGIPSESDNDHGVYWELYSSDNWIRKTLEYPLEYDPGEKMRYNTFQTHLLSGILTKASGMSTKDFAQENLCDPIGIDIDYWETDPQGIYFGGNQMHFTPREMAVFGYLYLNKGKLGDEQVVPEDWIDLTLTASTNLQHPNEWGSWKNYNYAWLWWIGEMNDYNMYMAYGYGGQLIVVFPDLNLIVTSTAENWVDSDTSTVQEWMIFDIITKFIVPSVVD